MMPAASGASHIPRQTAAAPSHELRLDDLERPSQVMASLHNPIIVAAEDSLKYCLESSNRAKLERSLEFIELKSSNSNCSVPCSMKIPRCID